MDDTPTLIGFRHSVYTRIVQMALIEMGFEADYVEVDPFCAATDTVLTNVTPFGRVPVLRHGAFTLTETTAIVGYLNDLTHRPLARPETPRGIARMTQVIGIIDAYGYQPLVRDVFSHGFYRQHLNEASDPEKVARGLVQSRPVLEALEGIAEEGLQLNGRQISNADIHLAPMIAYFVKVPKAAAMLTAYPALLRWWIQLCERPSLITTDPFSDQ